MVADSTKVSTLDAIYIRRGLRPCADSGQALRLDARHCSHNASLPYHQAGGPIPATHPGEKAARAPDLRRCYQSRRSRAKQVSKIKKRPLARA